MLSVKRTLFVGASLLAIYILFFLSYANLVGPSFGYMGFGNDFSSSRFFFSFLFVVFTISFIAFCKNDFDRYICVLLFVFVTAPNIVIFCFMPSDYIIVLWSVLCVPLTLLFMRVLPVFKTKTVSNDFQCKFLWFFLVFLSMLVFLAHGFKLNLDVFMLKNIYELRLESRESSTKSSVYAYFTLAKVICPIAIIWAFDNKNKLMALFSVFVLTYLYMTTGHKSVYFSVFIILAFMVGKNSHFDKLKLFLIGIVLLFCILRLLSEFFELTLFESLFIRRLFYIPALLNIYFFDYFSDLKLYYSGSFLSLLIDYPLDRVPAREIGLVYFNSEDMSANNGYLSDGFANFGSLGILISIFFTSWVFKFFKAYEVSPKYYGIIFVTFYAFQGSGLSASLFTHGVFLLTLMIPFFLRGSKKGI
ncbi:hypothetical protein J8Z24_03065 [Pseudoalteromonas sp. SCSIO 43201]|uniref:hypothetical protein n=1 Tax=Pseudoalteromonas sp. SCSIO 43201 TaxID=2822842 RepID=UPI002074C014|nr:hypothetical protein [Pseudoalteromonas sp. SCSIO 43201]USD29091.1 hypothetical protein J8Z24_03065 [Pseudoalteromonas sp. SCSIO 43201]